MLKIPSIVLLAVLVIATNAGAQVTVVSTTPANGAKDVDPSTTKFQVKFSEAVSTGGYSFVNTQHGTPLNITGVPMFSQGDIVCTVPVKLEPGITYAVSINHERFNNFRAARDTSIPVTPYLVVFTTASGSEPSDKSEAPSEVTVVRTYPENGAKNVDPKTGYIRIRFSAPVSPGGYSLVDTDRGEPIQFTGKPKFEDGNTLCIIQAKFKPGTTYAVGINSDKFNNFRSAADPNVAVTPYLLQFKTLGKPVKKTEGMTPRKWQEDLSYLADELPKRHINLFARITEEEWRKEVRLLSSRIPFLSQSEIITGLLKLVAGVGDQHTSINVNEVYSPPVLPLALHWYKDGVYVVAASEVYKNLLGYKLEKIGSMEIDKACETVSCLFPVDNEYTKRKSAPNLLVVPQILQALKAIPDASKVSLTFKDGSGNKVEKVVSPVGSGAEVKMVQAFDEKSTPLPLYRKNLKAPYWAEYVEKGNLVYFQYNQCTDSPDRPFAEMRSELEKLLSEHREARLVVDLRRNGGGNSSILDPFIDSLKNNSGINKKGKLFVIIGRYTFSSAMLNALRLQNETQAVFYGEPTSSAPNHYGEVRSFVLPNSNLPVCYSTKHFRYSQKDESSLVPGVVIEATFSDYLQGRDPVLEAIILPS